MILIFSKADSFAETKFWSKHENSWDQHMKMFYKKMLVNRDPHDRDILGSSGKNSFEQPEKL